jgi:hypothetical protein
MQIDPIGFKLTLRTNPVRHIVDDQFPYHKNIADGCVYRLMQSIKISDVANKG